MPPAIGSSLQALKMGLMAASLWHRMQLCRCRACIQAISCKSERVLHLLCMFQLVPAPPLFEMIAGAKLDPISASSPTLSLCKFGDAILFNVL